MLSEKFVALEQDMSSAFVERDGVIRQALLAVLTRQHMLILGPPGTAKSMLVSELVKRVTGARKFRQLMSSQIGVDEIIGPVDLIRCVDERVYARCLLRGITQAEFVFLDEFYRASGTSLDVLLTIMNERIYDDRSQADPIEVPLISLFAASNFIPDDDSLDAVDDRFVFRAIVGNVATNNSFKLMLRGKEQEPAASVSLNEIRAAQTEISHVKGTPDTLTALLEIRAALSRVGVVASDRRWKHGLYAVKAQAWLAGRDKTEAEDLSAMSGILWRDPKDLGTVQREVYRVAAPRAAKLLDKERFAEDIVATLKKKKTPDKDDFQNSLQQLEHILAEATGQAGDNPDKECTDLLVKMYAYREDISRMYAAKLGTGAPSARKDAVQEMMEG